MGVSFPPMPFPFPALVAFTLIFELLERAKNRTSGNLWFLFKHSFVGFWIWNFFATYWLTLTAINVPEGSEQLSSFIAGLLSGMINAYFMTIPVMLVFALCRNKGRVFTLMMFLVAWLSFEYLHFNWELSWAWLTLGHFFAEFPLLIQYIEFTGIHGVSLWILSINILLFLYFKEGKLIKSASYLLVALVLIPPLSGLLLTLDFRQVFQPSGEISVRIIQPNVNPYSKFDQQTTSYQIQKMAELANSPGIDTINLVLMPETALPQTVVTRELEMDPQVQPFLKLVKENHNNLITGITEVRTFSPEQVPKVTAEKYGDLYYDVCNSALMINNQPGHQTYQKAKLVPMVERTPFLETMAFLKHFYIDLGGSFGNLGYPDSSINLITNQGTKIAALICYESEFGEYTTEFVRKGAELISVITNDGWWLQSSGYLQHAAWSRLRAIETRRSLVRSANTGVSLVCNSKGEISQFLGWGKIGKLDARVPLYKHLTFYVQYGWMYGYLFLIAFFILIIISFSGLVKKTV